MPVKEEWREKFKDASPEQTVARIESLLKEAGLSFEHYFLPLHDIDKCISSRITLTGGLSSIGTNGKGTSKAFCAASAHAEFMERLQNRMFMAGLAREDPIAAEQLTWARGSDYHVVDYTKLADNECFLRLKQRLVASAAKEAKPVLFPEQLVDTLLQSLIPTESRGKVMLSPCYCPEKGVYESVPLQLCRFFFLSNGMAAGNTLPEAIIQAYCEVFERYVQNRIIDERISLPEIPRSLINDRYPNIAHIIGRIEQSGPYRVIVKDCSLGLRLPVVCGMVIDLSNGKFGFKFGSHPGMEIALERVFTESLQGRNLRQLTGSASLVMEEGASVSRFNSWNIAKVGIGTMPLSFFTGEPSYAFTPWEDIAGLDNRALVHAYTRLMAQIGGTVYIEDVSFMSFPTVCVYVQGISEVVPVDIFQLKENLFRYEVQVIMRRIATATDDEVRRILLWIRMKKNAALENSVSAAYGLVFSFKMPGYPADLEFLNAVCEYRLGNVKEAAQIIDRCIFTYDFQIPDPSQIQDRTYAYAVQKYIHGVLAGLDREKIRDLLAVVFEDMIVSRVTDDFGDPLKVLGKLYPACNHLDCLNCKVKGCDYPALRGLYSKLDRMTFSRNVAKKELHKVFDGYHAGS